MQNGKAIENEVTDMNKDALSLIDIESNVGDAQRVSYPKHYCLVL